MRKIIYLIVLLSGIAQAQDATLELDAFAYQWGIQDWPRLNLCGYQASFQGRVVGLILDVKSAGMAQARWDGRCHVPLRHVLKSWPQDLQPGRYVVAATLSPGRGTARADARLDRRNVALQILGVMGQEPNREPYLNAALQRICASPAQAAETDLDCARRMQPESRQRGLNRPPAPAWFFATQPGMPTLDQGEGGGNPFASALIELLDSPDLGFKAFQSALIERTRLKSKNFQLPEVRSHTGLDDWTFLPKPAAQKRVALVLAYSDYSAFSSNYSLPGARHDMQRIAQALQRAGFETQTLLDPNPADLVASLQAFAKLSATAQVALLYSTGHGVEVSGLNYLLPGDYPFKRGIDALKQNAIPLERLSKTLRAKDANLLFYGACRDNPLAP